MQFERISWERTKDDGIQVLKPKVYSQVKKYPHHKEHLRLEEVSIVRKTNIWVKVQRAKWTNTIQLHAFFWCGEAGDAGLRVKWTPRPLSMIS